MDIQFNTGRLYTREGQIIRAVFDAEAEVIHFADFSRACNGTIQVPGHTVFRTPGGLAQFVMSRYDRHEYWNSTESWAILMIQGRQDDVIHQFTI